MSDDPATLETQQENAKRAYDVAILPASVLRFDTLLNEPSAFEDQTRVRDYRHQMWPRWQEVLTDIRKLIGEGR